MPRDAGIRWTDIDGDHDFALSWPLRIPRPRQRRPVWRLETLSGHIHSERGATMSAEVDGVLRFQTRPDEFLRVLSERAGKSITYYEVRSGTTVEFAGTLISVTPADASSVALEPDADRFAFAEYAAAIRLRLDDPDDAPLLYEPIA